MSTEAKQLFDYVDSQMRVLREDRHEYARMIRNAKLDGIDYHEWPQYFLFIEMTAKWYAYREIKELLEQIIWPVSEEKRKEIFEALGI